MKCEDRTDSIYLYAAGALPDDEADELRRHLLTGCPQCVAELAGASASAAMLPFSLRPVSPPESLKDRLMQRIDRKVRFERRETVTAITKPETFGIKIFKLLVPAAVAAAVTLMATHHFMSQELNAVEQQTADYKRTMAAELEVLSKSAAERDKYKSDSDAKTLLVKMLSQQVGDEQAKALVASRELDGVNRLHPDETAAIKLFGESDKVRVVKLNPTPQQQGAAGLLIWDEEHGKWSVMVSGMKVPEPGKTYEIWYVTAAGAPIRAGIFDVDKTGSAQVQIELPAKLGKLSQFAVTDEKAGGSDSPTGSFQILTNL